VDPDHGTPTTVAWCFSKRTILEDASCDLRAREGTRLANIGRVVVAQTGQAQGDPLILAWARFKELDGVIWTALKSNFNEKANQPFSTEAAVSYIKTLTPEAKAKAAEYIWRAPDFVKTPLRSMLQAEPWFPKPGS